MAELFAADLNVERLLMGIALHGGTSFPVGKVEFLNWYPLSFRECLLAAAGERYVELLDGSGLFTEFKGALTDSMCASS